jgi:hypothetical protein
VQVNEGAGAHLVGEAMKLIWFIAMFGVSIIISLGLVTLLIKFVWSFL